MDTVSLTAREIAPYLESLEPSDDRQKEAIALLDGWDGDLAPDSAAAALFEVWCVHVGRQVLLPRLGPELFTHYYGRRHWAHTFRHQVLPRILEAPTAAWFGVGGAGGRDDLLRRALDGAIDELTGLLGDDPEAWRWGALHTATFAGRLAIIPDLAPLFTAGVVEMGGDDSTICQSLFEPEFGYAVGVIPSWRQVMDLADPDASAGTNTHGQSGNPASAHFADLLPLWSKGEYHPLPLSREAVDGVTETRLSLTPKG
jgi:penicillin amidase